MNTIDTAIRFAEPIASPARSKAGDGNKFVNILEKAAEQVDDLQLHADPLPADMLRGRGLDLHGAMIAVEKAGPSFELMMQVRNRMVAAYQEISRMQF